MWLSLPRIIKNFLVILMVQEQTSTWPLVQRQVGLRAAGSPGAKSQVAGRMGGVLVF